MPASGTQIDGEDSPLYKIKSAVVNVEAYDIPEEVQADTDYHPEFC